MQPRQLVYVGHLRHSYNHITHFHCLCIPFHSTENVTAVVSIFRRDLEEAGHSDIFNMTIKLMLHQQKNVHAHHEADQWSVTFQGTS